MGATETLVVPLTEASARRGDSVGDKALNLSRISQAGFSVPKGFCVTAAAYERFLEDGRLEEAIRMELGRKPLHAMRWEEIWDAALRIRSAFLSVPVPADVASAVSNALGDLGANVPVAVRSSAPGEDSEGWSFAGLHESHVGVVGIQDVLDALRMVWASLWSDAALLYRKELQPDPTRSHMAVLVQKVVDRVPSGVAFARDPRFPDRRQALVEAVPGPCGDLMDGLVEPDRWSLDAGTGQVHEWTQGIREADPASRVPLLDHEELRHLLNLDLPRYIVSQAEAEGMDPSRVILEVTESRVMKELKAPLEILTRLRMKGVGLSVDDFGTGYASLEQVKRIPFTELKIDRAFVFGASEDPPARAILESSVALGKRLGLHLAAEGAETQDDWDLVQKLGGDTVQGYFVSKPIPGEEIPDWVSGWNAHGP